MARDVSSIYECRSTWPRNRRILLNRLKLPQTEARMDAWQDLSSAIREPKDEITIHFVGKYTEYEDSYKSINEALFLGGFRHRLKVNLEYVEAEALEEPDGLRVLDNACGILVAPGFGDRGSRGMMAAAEIARTRKIPYFGICYGFQWAVVEYARNVVGLTEADSTEVSENTPHKVTTSCADLLGVDDMGGTMLGSYAPPGAGLARLPPLRRRDHPRAPSSLQFNLTKTIVAGSRIVGRSLSKFVEIVELPGHPWYLAVQFHPEFKSKPLRPHPLFAGFVEAAHRKKLAYQGMATNVTAIGDRRR